ncbi:glycosyl hydrolase catalytic core-domain-containing protein [Mycena galopus ATCC 62051]|nr:glycosyl hydrolase catalytic core-domain-containing protein [Mycena galopus ATCC 62051]
MLVRLSFVFTSFALALSATAASSSSKASVAASSSSPAHASSTAAAASTAASTTAASTTAAAASPTAASSTAAASTPSSTGTTIKGPNPKRGLAYAATNASDIGHANTTSAITTWIYNWGLIPPDYIVDSGIEFIPMQWGAAGIENLAVTVKGLNATTILTFNEPDFDQQSNINASFAAQLWMQYIEPLKASGVRLGGPAISSGSSGLPWLQDFMAACSQCTIDFLPFHWYGDGTGGFTDYLYSLHANYPNQTLWVTEFAETAPNDTVVLDFMNQTVTMLDGLDWVERYAWFGYFRPSDGSHWSQLPSISYHS